VANLFAEATDKGEVFDAVAHAAIELLGARAAQVLVDDPGARVLRGARPGGPARQSTWPILEGSVIPHGAGLAGAVWESRRPAFVEDVHHEPRWISSGLVREHDLHAYAGLPLMARGHPVGVLSILFAERRAFAREDRELMGLLADQAAIAIDNARLFAEAEQRRHSAEALSRVGRALSQSLDAGEVARRVADSVQGLMRISSFAVYRLDPSSGDLVPVAYSGDIAPLLDGGHRLARGMGASGLAAREPPEHLARMRQADIRSVMALPLPVGDRVVGALACADRLGRVYREEDIEVAQAFADRAALALETARLHQQVRAAHDFLKAIAESSVDAIVATDTRGHITYWSPGAEEALGYRAAEVLGRPIEGLYRSAAEAEGIARRLREWSWRRATGRTPCGSPRATRAPSTSSSPTWSCRTSAGARWPDG
jgi:GAF domain-containing protein